LRKITELFKLLLAILFHPMLIALVATVVVILIVHSFWNLSKYKLTLVESRIYDGSVMYDDVDNNGYSDRIVVVNNAIGTTGLSIQFIPQDYIEQWNFRGELKFVNKDNLLTGDYDSNGRKEVYSFSISGDSIFINYVTEIIRGKGEQRFITKVECAAASAIRPFCPSKWMTSTGMVLAR
jgi:hypothetical protein